MLTALRTPPALWKAQGKFRSPAPSADFSMMKTAPTEPSRGPASSGHLEEAEASRLMLSLANSSILLPAGDSELRRPPALQGEPGGGVQERRGQRRTSCCVQVRLGNFASTQSLALFIAYYYNIIIFIIIITKVLYLILIK